MNVTRQHPPVPVTARSLYDSDPTFRALIDTWVIDRRCPLPLVDLLLEYGLDTMAEAARWAATEPERETIENPSLTSPPYPASSGNRSRWFSVERRTKLRRSHWVPYSSEFNSVSEYSEGIRDALIWFLDNWRDAT